MSKITYTKIFKELVQQTLENICNHCSGHIRLFFLMDGEYYTILGHNEKYDNVTSFGGFSDPSETLIQTLIREYMEESLGSVTTAEEMEQLLLQKCVVIHRESAKGHHYTIFCNFADRKFDIGTIRKNFKQKRNQPDLSPGQKENDDIVIVSLKAIKNAISTDETADVYVNDTDCRTVKIRGINLPAYKWFIDTLKNNDLDGMF